MHKRIFRALLIIGLLARSITEAQCGWYLYVNPDVLKGRGIQSVTLTGGEDGKGVQRSVKVAEISKKKEALWEEWKRGGFRNYSSNSPDENIEGDEGGCCGDCFDGIPGGSCGFVACISTAGCWGLCLPCVIYWGQKRAGTRIRIQEENAALKSELLKVQPFYKYPEIVYKGMCRLPDLDVQGGPFQRVIVNAGYPTQRDLTFELSFGGSLNSSTLLACAMKGDQVDLALWGEEHKTFTASLTAELRALEAQLATIQGGGVGGGSAGAQGGWCAGGSAAQAFGRAVAKEAGTEVVKLIGRQFGLPI